MTKKIMAIMVAVTLLCSIFCIPTFDAGAESVYEAGDVAYFTELKIGDILMDGSKIELDTNTYYGYIYLYSESGKIDQRLYSKGDRVTVSGDFVLTDIYGGGSSREFNQLSRVTFDFDSEYMTNTTLNMGYASQYNNNVSSLNPKKNGYKFLGWFSESGDMVFNSSGEPIQGDFWDADSKWIAVGDHTLKAKWQIIPYTATLLHADGTVMTTETVRYGYSFRLQSTPYVVGYTFEGYYSGENATGTKYINSDASNAHVWDIESDATLYPYFLPNQYTVNLNANGGTVDPASITVTYDSTYGDIPTPVYTGHTFTGWYTELEGGTKIESSTPVTITSTQTLYAHWDKTIYSVTSGDTAHGSLSFSSSTATMDDTVEITVTPDVGWKVSSITANDTTITDIAENKYNFIMPANNVLVDVIYEKIPYTVSLDVPGGTTIGGNYSIDVNSATIGDTVTITTNPELGYIVGTVSLSNGDAVSDLGNGKYSFAMPAEDVTVEVVFAVDTDAVAAELQVLHDKIDIVNDLVNTKASISDLATAVADLTAAINDAEAAAKDYTDQQFAIASQAINDAYTMLNDAIAELEEDVQELSAEIAQANSKIDTNSNDISSLKTDTSALKASLTTAENDIAALNSTIAAIEQETTDQGVEISHLKTDVQDLTAAIASAEARITSAEQKIAILEGKVDALEIAKQDLEAAVAALEAAITEKADVTTLNAKVTELTNAITAAEAAAKSYTDGKATELTNAIANAKAEAVSAAEVLVNAAKAELQTAIDKKADITTLNAKVTELTNAITTAETAAKSYTDGKATELTNAIANAKTEAVSAAEVLVNAAKAELEAAIDQKADAATLNAKVTDLTNAITAAEAAAKSYTDGKATELTIAIANAKAEAVAAAEVLVNAAKTELEAAIDQKADAAEVANAIATLQNAISALEDVKDNYVTADAELKAELEAAISTAKQEAIEAAKGHIPHIGENGNWWVGDTDTGVCANGIKGDKGDKGDVGIGIAKIEKTATNGNVDTYTITFTNGQTTTFTVTNGTNGTNGNDGAPGKDGITPHIGENGNWWIGDTDTGVKAAAESTPAASDTIAEQGNVDTITIIAIAVAALALLSNLILWVLFKKKR